MKTENKKHLVIFSDYGLDDACALVYLWHHHHLFDQISVVCIAGNAPSNAALLNAQKLVDHAKNPKATAKTLLVHTDNFVQNYAALPAIHGKDGMGDLFDIPRCIASVPYEKWIKKVKDGAVVLSLGPCSVSLDFLKKKQVSQHIIMGGMVNAAPNHNGMEFNQALDVEAYNAQVALPHKIATLDTCRFEAFNLAAKRFDECGKSPLLFQLVNKAIELAEARHPDNCYIYDLIASIYLTHPHFFAEEETTDPWGNKLTQLRLNQENFDFEKHLISV